MRACNITRIWQYFFFFYFDWPIYFSYENVSKHLVQSLTFSAYFSPTKSCSYTETTEGYHSISFKHYTIRDNQFAWDCQFLPNDSDLESVHVKEIAFVEFFTAHWKLLKKWAGAQHSLQHNTSAERWQIGLRKCVAVHQSQCFALYV